MISCFRCNVSFPTLDSYKNHLWTHKFKLCNICITNSRYLPVEYETYRPDQLKKHMNEFHVHCSFCNYTGFDQSQLNTHMNSSHVRCDICIKKNTVIWFKDINSLVSHIESNHFICHYPTCRSEDMIAFETQGELMLHLKSVHHEKISDIDFSEFSSTNNDEDNDLRKRRIQLNQLFLKKLELALNGNKTEKEALQNAAKKFMNNSLTPLQYYKTFESILKDKKNEVFPFMLAAMPGGENRVLLNRIHLAVMSVGMEIAEKQFNGPSKSFSVPNLSKKIDPPSVSPQIPPKEEAHFVQHQYFDNPPAPPPILEPQNNKRKKHTKIIIC